MRLICCGGRAYRDQSLVWSTLDRFDRDGLTIAQGGASGADEMVREWCADRNVECITYAAQWETLGRRAGPVRNQRMLAEFSPDLVIAFPGGRGTAHMTRIARAAGVRVISIVSPAGR